MFAPTLLRRLVEDVGAGRVLLGTDLRSSSATSPPGTPSARLGLGREADTRAILWDNAAELLGLRSPA